MKEDGEREGSGEHDRLLGPLHNCTVGGDIEKSWVDKECTH